MEVLLHLTSQKLCGLRAQLSFISALLGFDTDESVCANKRGEKKIAHTKEQQTTISQSFSSGPFVSQPPKKNKQTNKKTRQGGNFRA